MKRSHGMSESREFSVWTDMQTRCYNAKYKDFRYYGGRGIKVCERWLGPNGFPNFIVDMGRRPSARHSIDRINQDGDYEPANCRWATAREQANNKSTTIRIEIGGVTKTLAEWCDERGVDRKTAWLRYSQGISSEALFRTTCEQLTHDGITDTVAGWSKRTGIKPTTIIMRLRRKWPVKKALTRGLAQCAS